MKYTCWKCIVAVICLASLLALPASTASTHAQEGQGVYVTQAAAQLTKLVDTANKAGYKLQDNSFSIGGGWLKQSANDWIALYTVQLNAGTKYRFLAAGDNDAKDVDLDVSEVGSKKVVASDTAAAPTATVDYTPTTSGRYLVRIRLFSSDQNLPCVCLGIVMSK